MVYHHIPFPQTAIWGISKHKTAMCSECGGISNIITLWLFNIAMGKSPFLIGKPSNYKWAMASMAMLNNQRVKPMKNPPFGYHILNSHISRSCKGPSCRTRRPHRRPSRNAAASTASSCDRRQDASEGDLDDRWWGRSSFMLLK